MVDAAIVHVPAKTIVDVTIQVIYYSSHGSEGNKASYPRTIVNVGEDSHLDFIQTYVSSSKSEKIAKDFIQKQRSNELTYEFQGDAETVDLATIEDNDDRVTSIPSVAPGALIVANTHISVADNAVVRHSYSQELPPLYGRHAEVLSADLKTNASYTLTSIQMGCLNSRLNVHANILGETTNCTINGVMLCEEKQYSDIHSSIVHDSPSARSRQQQRIVVSPKSQGVFKGRIRIPKHAQETDSDQLCRSVMLGERARVIAMPTLEITADNVVCSHGASVADLDPNAMFYLKSRGISALVCTFAVNICIL